MIERESIMSFSGTPDAAFVTVLIDVRFQA